MYTGKNIKLITEKIHSLFCNNHNYGNISCAYNTEKQQNNTWGRVQHKLWLNKTRIMMGLCTDMFNAKFNELEYHAKKYDAQINVLNYQHKDMKRNLTKSNVSLRQAISNANVLSIAKARLSSKLSKLRRDIDNQKHNNQHYLNKLDKRKKVKPSMLGFTRKEWGKIYSLALKLKDVKFLKNKFGKQYLYYLNSNQIHKFKRLLKYDFRESVSNRPPKNKHCVYLSTWYMYKLRNILCNKKMKI